MHLLLVNTTPAENDLQFCDDRSFVARCNSADEALLILGRETFDLVVVDVVDPAEAGFAFIQRLRMAKNDVPLVALTGQQASDRVRALGLGADDAVAQPVDIDELRARILSVAKRHKGHKPSLLQAGGLSLSLETHEVMFGNIPVHLTASEYSMLELLVLRKDQIITKNMFLNHLYGGMDEPETKIIDVFICKLRRKLDQVGAKGMIGTVWGHGYVVRNQPGESSLADAPVRDDSRRWAAGLSGRLHAES